mgnify:CR=1
MKFPHKSDDPLDTWPELYLGWTAAMFTFLVFMGLLYYITSGLPCK